MTTAAYDPLTFTPPGRPVTDDLDMASFRVQHPDKCDWPDEYYSDLLALCQAQIAAVESRRAQIRAEQADAQTKQRQLDAELLRCWDDAEARDRIVASLIVNTALWARLPALLQMLDQRWVDLNSREGNLHNYAGARARQAAQEAERAAKAAAEQQRQEEEAALRLAVHRAQMSPAQRQRIDAEEAIRRLRPQRQAAQRAKQTAEQQAEADRLQRAADWVQGVIDGTR